MERTLQLIGFNGFEQVVDGVGFEGAQRVLVVGGGEDDEGLDVEAGEQFETVEARHLDVEEEHIDWRAGWNR